MPSFDQRPPADKPLNGFGPLGWVLLPAALGLLVVLVSGYDLRFQLLRGIDGVWGWSGVHWFVARPLTAHSLWSGAAGPSLVSLLYLLPAFHIYPRRIAWWWYAGFVLACLVCPMAAFTLPRYLVAWRLAGPAGVWSKDIAIYGVMFSFTAALWVATRSRTLSGVAALAGLAVMVWDLSRGRSTTLQEVWAMAALWHGSIATALLIWAIRARVRFVRSLECRGCGYDLRGAPRGPCPECGTPAQALCP